MDRQDGKKSNQPSAEDVITQRELASQLIFQNAEYPHKLSLWERYKNGARIEPGPLTIVHPYFDLGPFIIPTSEGARRADRIRQSIRDANLALDSMDRQASASEFSRVSQQITARAWEAVRERSNASLHARNWSGFRMLVRDHLYVCELACMVWAANKCIGVNFNWLGTKAFGIASTRAAALAYI